MSIYNRAVIDAPKVDRRIVRAVNLVSVAIPVPGGVFGLEDVWRALQALAKKEGVPLECGHADVSRALDALVGAGILTCRAGAYAVKPPGEAAPTRAVPKKPDAPPPAAEPIAAPVVEVVEEAAEPEAVVEAPVVEPEPPKAPKGPRKRPVMRAAAEAGTLEPENQAVLDLLAVQDMTTASICAALVESPSATRCRLLRLHEAGLIKRAGKVVANDRPSMNVWALVEPRDQSAGPGEPDGGAEVETTPPPTPAQDPPSALGTPQVPSQPQAPALPPPVRDRLWTARPRKGPDEHGRWLWEARATVGDDRVSRGLGWLDPGEVLDALREQTGTGPEGLRLGQQVWNTLSAIAPKLVEPFRAGPLDPFYVDDRLPAFLAAVEKAAAMPQPDTTGPAWPSLHSLDLDAAEEALGAIERRLAAWRELLRAAREVAA